MRYREIHSTDNQYFLCVQYWWAHAHRVLKYESLGLPPVLALARLLLLRVIRSFFALSESPCNEFFGFNTPHCARSFFNCNWKLENTLFMAIAKNYSLKVCPGPAASVYPHSHTDEKAFLHSLNALAKPSKSTE